MPGPHHISLPPAPLPNFLPHGVNPPRSGGIAMISEPIQPRRGHEPLSKPKNPFTRIRGHVNPPTWPPAPVPTRGGGVTTIRSKIIKGGFTSFAAPTTGSKSGSGSLLLLAGAAVVVLFLVMRKGKGKAKK